MENLIIPFFIVNFIISLFIYLKGKDNEKQFELLKDNLERQSKKLSVLKDEFYEFYCDVKKQFKFDLFYGDINYVITKRLKRKREKIFDNDMYDNYYEITSKKTGECYEVAEHHVYKFITDFDTNN